jgi:hypothetical protein
MTEWKKPLFIGIGWGLGTAIGVVLLVGGFLWYQSRPKPPKPPKPWNAAAIKAEYDRVGVVGEKNEMVFYYTLENTTDFDYRVEEGHSILMSAKLRKHNNLVAFTGHEGIDYPIVVPAKKRMQFPIHLVGYSYSVSPKDNADDDERKKYREAFEKYVNEKLPNLDGFDLLDETNRYEIIFPAGWKHN